MYSVHLLFYGSCPGAPRGARARGQTVPRYLAVHTRAAVHSLLATLGRRHRGARADGASARAASEAGTDSWYSNYPAELTEYTGKYKRLSVSVSSWLEKVWFCPRQCVRACARVCVCVRVR